MCGISGYITKGKYVKNKNIVSINNAIKHRGPDDEGYVLIKNNTFSSYSGAESVAEIKNCYPKIDEEEYSDFALGFRRLSILELSEKGHQPMLEGAVCITFNGEIYNFHSLKKQLQSLGYVFESESDTEVVLKAYLHWGIAMVERLNGMFAIAIVDLKLQKTFLIRDRLGIKPLFYYKEATSFIWCSEIKGILEAQWAKASMSLNGLLLNYQFKTSISPQTCFNNIYSVPPAHILCIDNITLTATLEVYWQIPVNVINEQWSLNEAVEAITDKLKRSIHLQMNADVPLISMMSGGIDSTLITALAHQQNCNLSCYTLSIDGSGKGNDELPQARDMALHLGIEQYIHQIKEEDIVENALNLLSHFEEPYNSLDVIFNAAHYLKDKNFKVVLSGNGADEVFGGYAYYKNLTKWEQLKPFGFLEHILPTKGKKIKQLKYYLSLKNVGQFFLSTTGGMRDIDLKDLIKDKNYNQIKHLTEPFVDKNDFISNTEGLFYYDLKYSVGAHHVYHDDICAMRYSIEMRYPYLDHELIELVASIPLKFRYNNKINKPLLRKVAQNHIQQSNLNMSKKGFNMPQDYALQTNKTLQNFAKKQVNFLKTTELFDSKKLDSILLQDKMNNNYAATWQLISTAVWMQKYL